MDEAANNETQDQNKRGMLTALANGTSAGSRPLIDKGPTVGFTWINGPDFAWSTRSMLPLQYDRPDVSNAPSIRRVTCYKM